MFPLKLSFKVNSHCYYSMEYWRNWWHVLWRIFFQLLNVRSVRFLQPVLAPLPAVTTRDFWLRFAQPKSTLKSQLESHSSIPPSERFTSQTFKTTTTWAGKKAGQFTMQIIYFQPCKTAKNQISVNRGSESRFALEAIIKALISKSSQSSIMITLNHVN